MVTSQPCARFFLAMLDWMGRTAFPGVSRSIGLPYVTSFLFAFTYQPSPDYEGEVPQGTFLVT